MAEVERLGDGIGVEVADTLEALRVLGAARRHELACPVIGVTGSSGKTTTIAKLARGFAADGLSVLLVAGDTFRAAAIEQLRIWGDRVGCPVIATEPGADAAGLAFDALQRARAEGTDVLLIDTAGRLQNRADLMAELQKIVRALRKLDPEAPPDCVLDRKSVA